jgi:hypothetical protein
LVFYETDVFTARIVEFIDDESYSALQAVLVADPEAGDLIPKNGACERFVGWAEGVASAVEFGSFTTWSASMRFSCSMSIPRIEN